MRADEDLSHQEGAVRWCAAVPTGPGTNGKTGLWTVSLWGEAAQAVYD